MVVNYYNNNSYNHPYFRASNAESGILTKPIEKVQKTIESSVDTFDKTQDEKKKKIRNRAIWVGSTVLVLGTLTMLLNPSSSGRSMKALKSLQNKLDIKMQQSKDNFMKTKLYGTCKKIAKFFDKGQNFYFNLNSTKDVVFQNFCINQNKKYPEFIMKNKFLYKTVKSVDDLLVKIFRTPHLKITEWFDKISQRTVKSKYSSTVKQMDFLDDLLKKYKEKLPTDKKKLLDAKLKEIAQAKSSLSEPEILKRLTSQEKLMANLEGDLWKNIYSKDKGFFNNSGTFWVQNSLKNQKAQVEKDGVALVEKFIGSKDKKGLYDEAIGLLKNNIDKKDSQLIDDVFNSVGKKLRSANKSECIEYFDKKRDLVIGGAPTDIVTQLFTLGACGLAVTKAEKDERWQRAFTTGLPVITGLGSSLIFSALLYSGGVGILAGAAVGGATTLACYLINKYVFGNKDPDEESVNKDNVKSNLKKQQGVANV